MSATTKFRHSTANIPYHSLSSGVVTQDMLPEVGHAFVDVFGNEGEKGWGSGGKL